LSKQQQSVWDKETTGFADDFDAVIANSYFGTNTMYADGNVLLLNFELKSPDTEVGDQQAWFSCGNGWSTPDNKIAVHEKGHDAFNQSTMVRGLVRRALQLPGVAEVLIARDSEKGPLNAEVWIGLKFHWKIESVGYGGRLEDRQHLFPTAFLGVEPIGPYAGKKAGPAPAAEAPMTKAAGKTDIKPSVAVLRAKLVVLAKQCENYDEFATKAVEVEGVAEVDQLIEEITDTEGGIWAKHGKK